MEQLNILNGIIILSATAGTAALIYFFYPRTIIEETQQLVGLIHFEDNSVITYKDAIPNIITSYSHKLQNLTIVPNPPLTLEEILIFKDVYADEPSIIEKIEILEKSLNHVLELKTLFPLTNRQIYEFIVHSYYKVASSALIKPMPQKLLLRQIEDSQPFWVFGQASNLTFPDVLNNFLVDNTYVILGTLAVTGLIVLSYLIIYYVFKTTYSGIGSLISLKLYGIKTWLINKFIN